MIKFNVIKQWGQHTSKQGGKEIIDSFYAINEDHASQDIYDYWQDEDRFPVYEDNKIVKINNQAGEPIWELGDTSIGDDDLTIKVEEA